MQLPAPPAGICLISASSVASMERLLVAAAAMADASVGLCDNRLWLCVRRVRSLQL